jgi:murein DD-endopeptidase MepM/ murein hydrolase activator NlpD
MTTLTELLANHAPYHPAIPDLGGEDAPLVFDFSSANADLARLDLSDTPAFSAWVDDVMAAAGATVAIGRYGEDRVVYRHSPLFDGETERRSVHLGIDLFAPAETAVHCPLEATVHSLADNAHLGDYGPTVILEHRLGDTTFWTLWGHLSRASLSPLAPGRIVRAGEMVAALGRPHENGGWPPHLHVQIITEIGDHRGDYPGVAAPSEREAWLERCPDPNLLLGIPGLD